jgi:hypothetical protein
MPGVARGFAVVDRHRLFDASVRGVIRARALVDLGVPETTVYDRCRDGGPWQRLAPGIVLLTTGRPTTEQRIAAALLHGGPDAVLTGLHACQRHGVRRGPAAGEAVHVLVPHTRQVRSTAWIQVERSERLPRAIVRDGLPLAPVPRAVIDSARRLRDAREITELLADPVQQGLSTVAHLSAELRLCGRRGSATPRRVLAAVSDGIRSAAEREARRLWRRSGLPEPMWNVPVLDSRGVELGIADAWWDEIAFAWEINSYEWHLNPESYAREQEKMAAFVAAGVPVLPTQPSRMWSTPKEVLTELWQAYRHAATRPRPNVRALRPQ